MEGVESTSERKIELQWTEDESGRKDETCISFLIREEDHTLGNSLKSIISKFPEVEFCGYNVPHPLEDKIMFRIQTRKGHSAIEVLKKGLKEIDEIFGAIKDKFQDAMSEATNKGMVV